MDEVAPTADEIAAALAAVTLYLSDENQLHIAPRPNDLQNGWQHSIKLLQQQRIFTRTVIKPEWGTIERLRLG